MTGCAVEQLFPRDQPPAVETRFAGMTVRGRRGMGRAGARLHRPRNPSGNASRYRLLTITVVPSRRVSSASPCPRGVSAAI